RLVVARPQRLDRVAGTARRRPRGRDAARAPVLGRRRVGWTLADDPPSYGARSGCGGPAGPRTRLPTTGEDDAVFNTLSDRLTSTFKNLRAKGRLSEADIDATIREIRRALLDADVAVP